MDDFTPYGETFQEALDNLENVLKKCIKMRLFLRHEKSEMFMNEGIVLGHYVSSNGIKVDPTKVAIIHSLPAPQKQKDVQSILENVGYYRIFIKYFSKLVAPKFYFITKDANLNGQKNVKKHLIV